MARKRGDDPAWDQPGIGGDADAPVRPPGTARNHGVVTRLGDEFWRACDTLPLSVPRWGSRARMNANLKHMLEYHDETTIRTSFQFFRSHLENLRLDRDNPAWEVYFRHRQPYLREATRASEGRRGGQPVRKAGDITVDNDRFHVRNPGEGEHRPEDGIEFE